MPQSNEVGNAALLDAVKKEQWDHIRIFCSPQEKNKPDQKIVSTVLTEAVKTHRWDIIALLCAMTADNKPDAQAVAYALEEAAYWGKKDLVVTLYAMQTENKPGPKAVSTALRKAADAQQWDIACLLGAMIADNKPDEDAIAYAIEVASLHGQPHLAEAFDTEMSNNTSQKELQKASKEPGMGSPEAPQILQKQSEEQTRQNQLEETQRRQAMARIDEVLYELGRQIGLANQHHSAEATEAANHLLTGLCDARNRYADALNHPDVTIAQENSAFKQACIRLMEEASLILERDLGLGEVLGNALKALINAVIWLGTWGHRSSFFPPTRSRAIIAMEQTEQHLELRV